MPSVTETVVVRVPEQDRFEARMDEGTGVLTYELRPGSIVFVHTVVPEALEGRGVGGALARAGLDYAREQGLGVVPQCPFVKAWIERHPDYADLVEN